MPGDPEMPKYPFVSVIIPTYNREKLLGVTLASFIAQDYPRDSFEIIVADNNSSDGTKTVVSKCQADSPVPMKYLFEKRQGVHYARNSAAKIAAGEILYFTDDDMIADKSLLANLVRVFDLDPQIASATGKVIARFDVPPPEWVKKELINGWLSVTEEGKAEDLVVSRDDMVYSCHQAVRRSVFFECGGFNPENTAGVWIGDGETGLGIKIKNAGYKFAYTADSVIFHMIPEGRTTLKYLISRVGNQGYCDAFTDYRRHRDRNRILGNALTANVRGVAQLARTTVQVLRGRQSWRFVPAWVAYWHRRNEFSIRLFRDAAFREAAEIDDWLADGEPHVVDK